MSSSKPRDLPQDEDLLYKELAEWENASNNAFWNFEASLTNEGGTPLCAFLTNKLDHMTHKVSQKEQI